MVMNSEDVKPRGRQLLGKNYQILKRNGEILTFDQEKITSAIFKAARAVGEADRNGAIFLSNKVCELIKERFHKRTIPAVEEIQDIVEHALIDQGLAKTAKAYILYREQHAKMRDTESMLLDIKNTMDGYLKQSDWRVKENSNVNYSLGGLILHNSGTITANYWLNHIYSKEIAEAHKGGAFHIHDLSMFSGYCAGWSLRQLIEEGLSGVKNKISSKPARHLSTLSAQMVNFLGVLQNEWAGAQAFSSFDTFLAPFIRADNLPFETVKQHIQSFIFGINTPSRWGSQAPFTNITLDWTVPEDLRDEQAIVGGEKLEATYSDYQAEMDMVNRAFLEVMMEGDANGRGFPYPIPTYNITEDFNWDTDNARLLFQMTAKYGTPYFQNFINSDLEPGDVRSMCCRLQLDKRELKKKGGGLFGAHELTGSIGVVTLNLPRIGYLAASEDEFFEQVGDLMDMARDSLEAKREVISRLMDEGLFPYSQRYLKTWDNHFSTIGIVGMNECCLNFLDTDITSEAGRDFAISVLDFMRERLVVYQKDTENLYNLEATPAESTSYRLAKIDKDLFPDIITAGKDESYYTNSTQLPVNYTDDLFNALDTQEEIQTRYTGGTVFHAFMGESIDDWEVCCNLVKKIARNYRFPYFTVTPTFSICVDHGYLKGEVQVCPTCEKETEVYTRIVGYYRPVKNWNKGKSEEYDQRRTFQLPELDSPSPGRNGDFTQYKLFTYPNCDRCAEIKSYLHGIDGLIGDTYDLKIGKHLKIFKRYYPTIRDFLPRSEDGSLPLPIALFFDKIGNSVIEVALDLDRIKDIVGSRPSPTA